MSASASATESGEKRDLPLSDSLPKWQNCLGLIQEEARYLELHLGLPHERQGPKHLHYVLLLFRHTGRELNQKQSPDSN